INGGAQFLVGTQNLGITVAGTPSNPTIVRDMSNVSNWSVGGVPNVPGGNFVAITSTLADISSVSIGFANGSTANFIDDVTFARGTATTVPEPATFSLAGLGLVLSAIATRRRKLK